MAVPFTTQIVQVYVDAIVEPENPGGYACYGWVLYEGVRRVADGKGCIGKGPGMTNHVADYHAIIKALEDINRMVYDGCEIVLYSDARSALTRLLRGDEHDLPAHLVPLYRRARSLLRKIGGVRLISIWAEENTEASQLSWEAYREAQIADGKVPALHRRIDLLDMAHAAADRAFGGDEARRLAWQLAMTGKSSCKDMTMEELQKLVDSYAALEPDS